MEDRKKLTESVGFKCFAFFLVILMVLSCLGSALAVYVAWEEDFYQKSAEEVKAEAYGNLVRSEADDFLTSLLLYDTVTSFEDAHFAAYTEDGKFLAGAEGKSEDYFIYEISPYSKWIGKDFIELNMRANYHLSVLAVKKDGKVDPMPPANHVILADEHLVVLGKIEDIKKLSAK